jgi:16S rRNA (cytosine1402-N4)-methyltransferase
VYLDGTVGAGGYANALLEATAPDGLVVGLDLDPAAIERATDRLASFGDRFLPIHGGFHDAVELLGAAGIFQVHGIVLDLGLSSNQLADPGRGFSFQTDGPLDMRFDPTRGEPLSNLLAATNARRLADMIFTYGEEPRSRRIAAAIVDAVRSGSLLTTRDLADVVARAAGGRHGKIHPATRTFQALRIAVNREMENLEQALNHLPSLIAPGGRICVVSYHSLEDRLVKQAFRGLTGRDSPWTLLTKKPVRPDPDECRVNPRARSARLRAMELSVSADTRSAARDER